MEQTQYIDVVGALFFLTDADDYPEMRCHGVIKSRECALVLCAVFGSVVRSVTQLCKQRGWNNTSAQQTTIANLTEQQHVFPVLTIAMYSSYDVGTQQISNVFFSQSPI